MALAASLVVGDLPLLAQATSGSITGMVPDPQGAVVGNAKLTLIHDAQGASSAREVASTSTGSFLFSPVLPCTYPITVEVAGFKKYAQAGIILDVNQKLGRPPITLEVGATGETVTVEAVAVPLDTVSAERSGVVTGRQMVDIALNGRNYTVYKNVSIREEARIQLRLEAFNAFNHAEWAASTARSSSIPRER